MIQNNYDPYKYLQEELAKQAMMAVSQTQWDTVFTYPQNLQNAIELIGQALSGETEDRIFYAWLIDRTSLAEDREIISGIREDEIGHYALFRRLYTELTGQVPPQPAEESFSPPESYCMGLGRALKGEQNAVRRYRQILFAMQDRVHINVLTKIITDELRHGILYNYLYTKNGCGA